MTEGSLVSISAGRPNNVSRSYYLMHPTVKGPTVCLTMFYKEESGKQKLEKNKVQDKREKKKGKKETFKPIRKNIVYENTK